MTNPFRVGDIVKAAALDHYSLLHNCEYRVKYVSGQQVSVEGKAGWYPWTDFKKAGEMTYSPFKSGDRVIAVNPGPGLIYDGQYIVNESGAEYLTLVGFDDRQFPWTGFSKASDVTPNPNADTTGAAAEDQGVLVITEGLLFKNFDKIRKIAKEYSEKNLPTYAPQREPVYMMFVMEVLAELSKEA